MPSKRTAKFEVGDLVTWVDTDGDEPVRRFAAILAKLSTQFLVHDTRGFERIVRADEHCLELVRQEG